MLLARKLRKVSECLENPEMFHKVSEEFRTCFGKLRHASEGFGIVS
jgi:hypothetical protein